MKTDVIRRCELLGENRQIFGKAFKWESDYMAIAAASIVTSMGQLANISKIEECRKILKSNSSWVSVFRGNTMVPLIAKMSMVDNPEEYLKKVMNIYDLMCKNKLKGGEFRVMAAIELADQVDLIQVDRYIAKSADIYKRMSKEHSILTSSEDIPFAAMLALTDMDTEYMINDMEKSYDILAKKFFSKNAIQSMTHILTLCSDAPEVKCQKVLDVCERLKKAGHQFGSGYELCALGLVVLIDESVETIVDLICEADNIITKTKGFGGLSMGKAERRLLATQMVASSYNSDINASNNATVNSMLAITLAVEACLVLCAISASDAATTAATM